MVDSMLGWKLDEKKPVMDHFHVVHHFAEMREDTSRFASVDGGRVLRALVASLNDRNAQRFVGRLEQNEIDVYAFGWASFSPLLPAEAKFPPLPAETKPFVEQTEVPLPPAFQRPAAVRPPAHAGTQILWTAFGEPAPAPPGEPAPPPPPPEKPQYGTVGAANKQLKCHICVAIGRSFGNPELTTQICGAIGHTFREWCVHVPIEPDPWRPPIACEGVVKEQCA